MSEMEIRRAGPEDATFLAWVMQEADRMGGETSATDLTFAIGEEARLAFLACLANSTQDSYYHHKRFLIATLDGTPAAALSGYIPSELPIGSFELVVRREANRQSWPQERVDGVLSGSRFLSSNFFQVSLPSDALRVEWVATRPEFRRRGLVSALLKRLIDEARTADLREAIVGTSIGNDGALSVYRRAGFEIFAECRHADFEALYGAPGLVFLRQRLD
jgi:ribosomal protein S18 acetylase RimI-like enzyme